MEHVGHVWRIRPGLAEEYDRRHASIWPELEALFHTLGVERWIIYRWGDIVFSHLDVVDYGRLVELYNQHPIAKRWEVVFSSLLEYPNADPETGWPERLRLVWSLEAEEMMASGGGAPVALESLIAEYNKEMRTTRRLLERIPPDQLGWRPHPKSFTAAGLASHIVECVDWLGAIFSLDETDIDPSKYQPYEATSLGALLTTFDEKVTNGNRILTGLDESALQARWRLKLVGRVRVERSKADAFRDFMMSHMVHHRGQLSVYLRLLDVPVPGAYGPTADE